MKNHNQYLFIFLLILLQLTVTIDCFSQCNVIIHCNQAHSLKLTIKRGDMCRAEVNNDAARATIDSIVAQGYDFYLGHRNYNEPSNMAGACGKPCEFYKEGDTIKFRINSNMTDLRKHAQSRDIPVFQQFNRVPLSGSFKDDVPVGTYDIFTFQEGWYRDGKVSNGRPDGLLPIKSQYELFAELVAKYMIACDSVAGINSVWTGFDEPAHTLGFREDEKTEAALKQNTRRYVEFFAPLAIRLKNAGKTIGGIQLNAANAGSGLYEIATEELKKRNAYIDYFTIQNYQGGYNNKNVINRARQALQDSFWSTTKVFFNRYGYWKGIDTEIDEDNIRNSSREMVAFLNGEKIIVDNADIMYGYAMEALEFTKSRNKMLGQIGMFLNKMPEERKKITFSDTDLDGFVSEDDDKLMAIIWNKSGKEGFSDLSIRFDNFKGLIRDIELKKGSGTNLEYHSSANFDSTINELSNIELQPYDFLLLTINKSNSANAIVTPPSNTAYIYPEKDMVHIKNIKAAYTVTLYDIHGNSVLEDKICSDTALNISNLERGLYLIILLNDKAQSIYKFIKN